tara:strand:- start:59 stop:1243 length:1185 start_codon:yes stop_codon:yes gene_type:complete
MAKLPGAYELMATAASPAINFTRGLLGYQDPFLTQTMQDRMTELEAEKGPTGSIGYEDYGLPVSTPGGRFTGGLFDLLINNPVDFGLAGSVGRYGFSPEGRTDLEYNFTPDQDTGSTGSAVLDFINKGGIKGLFDSSAIANEPMDIEDFSKKITPMAKPDVVDVNRIPGRIQEAVEPQYRIRDQLSRDFLQGGLFRDAKQGLGQTKDEFLKDISGITRGLGSIKDKGIDIFGSGKEIALRGIGNLIAGPIGGFIGGALGRVKETPEQKAMKDFYRKETGLDDIGRIQSGIMQGYAPVSLFGPQGLTSAIDKRLATILRTEQKKKKQGLELSQELIKRRKELEALKAREEAARVAATRNLAEQNRREGTGGYQSNFAQDKDFMGGSGTAKDMGSS